VIQIDNLEASVRQQMAQDVRIWLLGAGIIAPFDASRPGWREEFGRTD
jgi:hypothetical protein